MVSVCYHDPHNFINFSLKILLFKLFNIFPKHLLKFEMKFFKKMYNFVFTTKHKSIFSACIMHDFEKYYILCRKIF